MSNHSIGHKSSRQAWENENLFCHDLPSKPQSGIGKVLVTSASGYIGGRLVPELLARGYRVRVMVRAAIIIGSGSASYEIIQNLVRKLPVFLIPRWAKTKCQPIAISDVIKYLVGVLEIPETSGKAFDIGGAIHLTLRPFFRLKGIVGISEPIRI